MRVVSRSIDVARILFNCLEFIFLVGIKRGVTVGFFQQGLYNIKVNHQQKTLGNFI